jgi:hypothetical protein
MNNPYLVITIVAAALAVLAAVQKLRRDPRVVHVMQDVVGVPLKYLPLLAACLFAGAVGLVLGIWWRPVGIAAGVGLVVYFVGAVVAHLRVRDVKGVGAPTLFLALCVAALVLRIMKH